MKMNNLNFVICDGCVIFRPTIFLKRMLFFKKTNVSKKSYIGKLLVDFFKDVFSGSSSIFVLYLLYYRCEYKDYYDFLQNHFNLTENEFKSIKSIWLRYKRGTVTRKFYHFYGLKPIMKKLNQYFVGEFCFYED